MPGAKINCTELNEPARMVIIRAGTGCVICEALSAEYAEKNTTGLKIRQF